MAQTRSEKWQKAMITRPIWGCKWERLYWIKTTKYGKFAEVFDYNKIQATYRNEREDFTKSKEGTKQEKSLYRTRNFIYQIVEANRGRHGKYRPVFFTLTYKFGKTDVRESNKDIKALMRRLNVFLGYSPKYIVVPERHESGKIHYHGVFFNLPFIWVEKFKEDIWKNGSVDLQTPKKIRSVSAYLSKYLTKDTHRNLSLNDKAYFTSRGLYRPITDYTNEYPRNILKVLEIRVYKKYIKSTIICKH